MTPNNLIISAIIKKKNHNGISMKLDSLINWAFTVYTFNDILLD